MWASHFTNAVSLCICVYWVQLPRQLLWKFLWASYWSGFNSSCVFFPLFHQMSDTRSWVPHSVPKGALSVQPFPSVHLSFMIAREPYLSIFFILSLFTSASHYCIKNPSKYFCWQKIKKLCVKPLNFHRAGWFHDGLDLVLFIISSFSWKFFGRKKHLCFCYLVVFFYVTLFCKSHTELWYLAQQEVLHCVKIKTNL